MAGTRSADHRDGAVRPGLRCIRRAGGGPRRRPHPDRGTGAGQPVPVVGTRQRKPPAPAPAWATLFQRYEVVLAPVMPTTAFPHDIAGTIADRVLDVDATAVP